MSLEVTSMGLLSKFYENLKMCPEKKKIASHFGLPHPYILQSWMHGFSHVRNICAHHERLWNRTLSQIPKLPKKPIHPFLANRNISSHKPYGILSCMAYIMNIISPAHHFTVKIKELFKMRPNVDLTQIGFPENWESEILWK
jgi:abortive infection bacteriophage resistance protein